MTREETMEMLRHCGAENYCDDGIHGTCKGCNRRTALDIAIDALNDIEKWRTWSHTYDNACMDRERREDFINRQDAIEAMLELNTDGRVSWKDAVIDTLDALPSAKAGWIPVSERLPEVGEICLLTVHEYGWNCKEYTRVIIGEYSDNYANHILAWMPLPTPYREDIEDYKLATEQMEHDAIYEPTYNSEDGSM